MSKSGGRKPERMDTLLRLVYGYQRTSLTDLRIASRCLRKPGSAAVISDINMKRYRSRIENCSLARCLTSSAHRCAEAQHKPRSDFPPRVAVCPLSSQYLNRSRRD